MHYLKTRTLTGQRRLPIFRCLPVLVLALAGVAQAGTLLYSCPSSSDCNGNLYAVSAFNLTGNTWQIFVDIDVTSSYTGNIATDAVDALAIGSFANSYTDFSLSSNPGSNPPDWLLEAGGLNASGCDGAGNPYQCVYAPSMADAAKLTSAGTILEWSFQLDTTSLGSAVSCTENPGDIGCLDLKYHYINSAGDKVGSLGSFAIDIQPGDGGGGGLGGQMPEPMTFVLAGAGLLGLGFLRRQRS